MSATDGGFEKRASQCVFVVLFHEMPPAGGRQSHWDFMLQAGGRLKTWALQQPPDEPSAVPASALPDHRLAYLDYEGPVSAGRGSVVRWDRGTYECIIQTPGCWSVRLAGDRLLGVARLKQTPNGGWRYSFEKDTEKG